MGATKRIIDFRGRDDATVLRERIEALERQMAELITRLGNGEVPEEAVYDMRKGLRR